MSILSFFHKLFPTTILIFTVIKISSSVVSQDPNDVHFYLYPSKENPRLREEIILSSITGTYNASCGCKTATTPTTKNGHRAGESSLIHSLVTPIIIHDFGMDSNSFEMQAIKNAYLTSTIKSNVILVDWGPLSTPTIPQNSSSIDNPSEDYHSVVSNCPIVSKKISQFLHELINVKKIISVQHVHLIGYGLGGHVAGGAGDTFTQKGQQLWRVTGLDPSGPLFGNPPPKPTSSLRRLTPQDAYFVDVIHTGGGFQGDLHVFGDATFFVNGGLSQPASCDDVSTLGLCSHNYSIKVWTASFSRAVLGCACGPLGYSSQLEQCVGVCPGAVFLGPYAPNEAKGVFYVREVGL